MVRPQAVQQYITAVVVMLVMQVRGEIAEHKLAHRLAHGLQPLAHCTDRVNLQGHVQFLTKATDTGLDQHSAGIELIEARQCQHESFRVAKADVVQCQLLQGRECCIVLSANGLSAQLLLC